MQGFEKMVSGMYLGEIVRRVILRMSEESDSFGPVASRLSEPFTLRYIPSSSDKKNQSLRGFHPNVLLVFVLNKCVLQSDWNIMFFFNE